MAWRAWSAAAILGLAAGCATTEQQSRAPVLPGDSAPVSHPPPTLSNDGSDDDAALENWKSSVLDRADGDTLALIRKDLVDRIQRLKDMDKNLSYLPPGIAIEERTRIVRRIAFEEKRLSMVDK